MGGGAFYHMSRGILPHERGRVDAAMALSLLQAAEEACARMTNLGFVVRIVTRNPSPPPRSPLISVRIVTMNPPPPPTRISHVTNRILFALNKRARNVCTVGIGRARSTKSRRRRRNCRLISFSVSSRQIDEAMASAAAEGRMEEEVKGECEIEREEGDSMGHREEGAHRRRVRE